MRTSTMAFILVVAATSCAAQQKRPELAKLLENTNATWQVDVLPNGHGSGAVIHEDGYILTCHHVAGEGERKLRITIAEDGGAPKDYDAVVIASAKPPIDLAVIKVDRKFAHPVTIAEAGSVTEGDSVYNIGFPYGFGKLVGRGYVVKTHYDYDVYGSGVKNGLALDIPDGPGTSGSGVYAVSNGDLVGVMKLLLLDYVPGLPPTVVKIATGTDDIRKFLAEHHIQFNRPSTDKNWKLNISSGPPPYQIYIPAPQR